MAEKANNVISFSQVKNTPPLGEINTRLINIFQKYIPPAVPVLMDTLISHCTEMADSGENNSQIMQYMDLKHKLAQQKTLIQEAFLEKCIVSFDQMDSPSPNEFQISCDQLSLVDNSVLDQDISCQSAANLICKGEPYAFFLNAENRLGHIVNIATENIPFGAIAICRNFSGSLKSLDINIENQAALLTIFAQELSSVIYTLWTETDKYLDSIGLHAIKKEIVSASSQKTRTSENHVIQNSDSTPTQDPSEEATIKQAGRTHKGLKPSSTNNQSASINHQADDQFMEALANKVVNRIESLIQIPQSDIDASEHTTVHYVATSDLTNTLTAIQNELSEQSDFLANAKEIIKQNLRNHGVSEKLSSRHNDLIDFVGMLFEFILDDHDLPDSVKKSIGLLQIPVLKLTLLDTTFLSDRHHPARDLLNKMASTGMHTTLEASLTEPVLELIDSTVKQIIKNPTQTIDDFKGYLSDFNNALDKIHNPETIVISNSSEETGEIHEASQTIITKLTETYAVPDSMETLVNEVWIKVLDHALEQQETGLFHWEFATNTLELLLWNLQRDNIDNCSQEDWLTLKNYILEHLNSVNSSPFQTVEWMQSLSELINSSHNDQLKSSIDDSDGDSSEPFEEIILANDALPATENNEPLNHNPSIKKSNDTDEKQDIPPVARFSDATLNIEVGQCVEFVGNNGNQFKCKLASIDKKNNRYIFINNAGMKVEEKHSMELVSGIEAGRIRVITERAFFDKALHKVMGRFLRF